MTAAVLLSGERIEQGLRRTNPMRDLGAVGELLEIAFGDELDASGRRMVREMKRYGRYGWLGWLAAQFMIPTATFPRGFVWIEEGRVVGNVHQLRVPGFPQRWVVANVAVHPEFQRRGIASALMHECIRDIRARRGTEVLLQVREKNQGARQLYEGLGFRVLSTRTDWIGAGRSVRSGRRPSSVRLRKQNEWRQQAAIARSQYPEGLVWPVPSIDSFYKPAPLAGILGLDYQRHWVVTEKSRVVGSLSLVSRPDLSRQHLLLAAAPGHRGKVEELLLAYGLHDIGRSRRKVQLSYPAGTADDVIERLGFVPRNTLHWMRRAL